MTRYAQAEKMEIIRMVETSQLPVKQTLAELEEKEDAAMGSDWDVPEEWISEEDQTLGPDGRLRR